MAVFGSRHGAGEGENQREPADNSQTVAAEMSDQLVRMEVAAASYATVCDSVLAMSLWDTLTSITRSQPAVFSLLQTDQFVAGQASSLVINLASKNPHFRVLGHGDVNPPPATEDQFWPVNQMGSALLVASTAMGVEYAPYAIVGNRVVLNLVGLNLPARSGDSSSFT